MLRKIVNALVLFLVLIGLNGCGKQYSSKQTFCDDSHDNRVKYIKDILRDNKIANSNKYSIMFTEYMLTKSKIYPTIEKLFPNPNYNDFLEELIPILYYSYSPDNYKLVPTNIKKDVDTFLVYHIPYEFSYGEEKFRKYISKMLDSSDSMNRNRILFDYYETYNSEQYAKGMRETEFENWVISWSIWITDFSLTDFLQLKEGEQLSFIEKSIELLLGKNSDANYAQERKRLNSILELWKDNSEDVLEYLRFSKVYYSITEVSSLMRVIWETVRGKK